MGRRYLFGIGLSCTVLLLPSNSFASPKPDNEELRHRVVKGEILSGISVQLYGRSRLWKQIAQWNSLTNPNHIVVNQILTLKLRPTLSPEEGKARLAQMWRRRLGKGAELESRPAEPTPVDFENAVVALAVPAALTRSPAAEEDEIRTFAETERVFQSGRHEDALKKIQVTRSENPDKLRAWIFEVRVLMALNRNEEAKSLSSEMVARYPVAEKIPFIRQILGK